MKYSRSVRTYSQSQCPCHGACRGHPPLKRCRTNPERTGNLPGRLLRSPPRTPPSARTHSRDIQPLHTGLTSGEIQEQRSLFCRIVLPGAARRARAAVVFYSCLGELWARAAPSFDGPGKTGERSVDFTPDAGQM